FAGTLGHQASIVVVQQGRVLACEAQHGGRFGGHDLVPLPHGLGQDGDVVLCHLAGTIERAHRNHGHGRVQLPGVDVHVHAVVFHHGHQGVAQFGVVVVHKVVDEVQHLAAGTARGSRQPATVC